jgi:hypothetical protein
MFPAPRQRWVDAMAHPEEAIRSITAPTLLVHGRDDQVIPLSTSLTMLEPRRRRPAARLRPVRPLDADRARRALQRARPRLPRDARAAVSPSSGRLVLMGLLDTDVIVMDQVRTFLSNDFAIHDVQGQVVGSLRTEGGVGARLLMGNRELAVHDTDGSLPCRVTDPPDIGFDTFEVHEAAGVVRSRGSSRSSPSSASRCGWSWRPAACWGSRASSSTASSRSGSAGRGRPGKPALARASPSSCCRASATSSRWRPVCRCRSGSGPSGRSSRSTSSAPRSAPARARPGPPETPSWRGEVTARVAQRPAEREGRGADGDPEARGLDRARRPGDGEPGLDLAVGAEDRGRRRTRHRSWTPRGRAPCRRCGSCAARRRARRAS